MTAIAHINDQGKIETLKEHCICVADYARSSLKDIHLGTAAYLAGLLHDMGKATQKFSNYIQSAARQEKVIPGSVNHTFAGVIYILERYHQNPQDLMQVLTSEIIAYAIAAHHGPVDCVDLNRNSGFEHRLIKDRDDIAYEEAKTCFLHEVSDEEQIDQLFSMAKSEISDFILKIQSSLVSKKEKWAQVAMLTQLIASAVINADRKGTQEFMENIKIPSYHPDWEAALRYFEAKYALLGDDRPINVVRRKISDVSVAAASRNTGVYTMNVPTGGGKTLSSLRYALKHAQENHLHRIIYVIPLLSVLDQNIDVIRSYLPKDMAVLEHHSQVLNQPLISEDELSNYELLVDGWDAPVIVTTLVQILEILFSEKNSFLRRMQALPDSLIIFDEIQSLPIKTIQLCNMAINFLTGFCHTSVLLTSATQPALSAPAFAWKLHYSDNENIISLSEQEMGVFKRYEVIDMLKEIMTLSDLADFAVKVAEKDQALLIVVNTKSEAQTLYAQLAEKCSDEMTLYHLSTSMCQKHRQSVLKRLRKDLLAVQNDYKNDVRNTKPVICVSTQLIEAGIDISFAAAIRVMAGLDNLVQTAGRVNRNFEYGKTGTVYFVQIANESLRFLKEIKEAQNSVLALKDTDSPSSSASDYYDTYYNHYYHHMESQSQYPVNVEGGQQLMTSWFGNGLLKSDSYETQLKQPFKEISKHFTVFDNSTIDVLVPYQDGKELQEDLRKMADSNVPYQALKKILKEAQAYTISLYGYQIDDLHNAGMLEYLYDGRVILLNQMAYDGQGYGLVENEKLYGNALFL